MKLNLINFCFTNFFYGNITVMLLNTFYKRNNTWEYLKKMTDNSKLEPKEDPMNEEPK